MRLRYLLLYALLIATLEGCGLRGDLYLPDENSEDQASPASTDVVQAESLDTIESADAAGLYDEPPEYPDDENSKETEDSNLDSNTPPAP